MDYNNWNTTGRYSDERPVRVIYIVGAGRSGSTMLDTILGNHPDVESFGELCRVLEEGWLNGRYCACGQPVRSCSFWSDVRRQWARRTGTEDEGGYGVLMREIEKRRLWLPRLAREVRRATPRFQEYAMQTKALFQAIRAVSGKPVIVDSSKRSARAYALSMISGIDLRVIHLVRDGRGTAWSHKKSFEKDKKMGVEVDIPSQTAWRTAAYWVAKNLQAEWVRRQLPPLRSMRVRYEDYVAQPRKVLARIGRLIDLDLSELGDAVSAGQPMNMGHTIAGNRLRRSGGVRLRADMEWIEKLPRRDRRMCWTLAGWLLKHYGYTKYPSSEFPLCYQALPENAAESNPQQHREIAA